MSIGLYFILWAIGSVLALLCFIFIWGFENDEGEIEITGTRVLCYVLMSLIGNWAFVLFHLTIEGLNVIVWIGERFLKVFDHTIYKSPSPKKKGKSK